MSRTHTRAWGLAFALSATTCLAAIATSAHAEEASAPCPTLDGVPQCHSSFDTRPPQFAPATATLVSQTTDIASSAPAPAVVHDFHQEPAAPPPSGERVILVAKNDLTGDLRPAEQGDRSVGVISLAQYLAREPQHGEAGFAAIEQSNVNMCTETGAWVRESLEIMGAAQRLGGDYRDLRLELAKLGKAQNRASWLRRGGEVVSSGLLCALSAGLYCGAAIAGNVNNEIQGSTYDSASKLNRHATSLNIDVSELNLRATILTMRMNIGWANEVQSYCIRTHADATLGNIPPI